MCEINCHCHCRYHCHLILFFTCYRCSTAWRIVARAVGSSVIVCFHTGLIAFQSTAAILITHKTSLPLLVPLPFEVKIRPFVCLACIWVGFRRLVRLEDKVILKKSSHQTAKCTDKLRRVVRPNLYSSRFHTSRLVYLRRFVRFLVWKRPCQEFGKVSERCQTSC